MCLDFDLTETLELILPTFYQADSVSFNTMLTLCGGKVDKHWDDAKAVFDLALKHDKVCVPQPIAHTSSLSDILVLLAD